MLMSQLLSLNVTNAPVPALLPVTTSSFSKNSGFLSVTEKESQLLSGIRV